MFESRSYVAAIALFAVITTVTVAKTSGADPPRPNIVLILSDDMGYGQPGFNGGNPDLTPNMDRLASQGVKLTQFYTHSVCAPTRAALLTGRYAFRTWSDWRSEDFGKPSYLKKLGLTLATNADGEQTRRIHALDTDERTVAEALREAGYFTSIIGKWHCGEWLKEHLPMQQGFMHQYGHYAWGIDYNTFMIPHNAPVPFHVYDWHRNEKPIQEQGYSTDLIAAEAETDDLEAVERRAVLHLRSLQCRARPDRYRAASYRSILSSRSGAQVFRRSRRPDHGGVGEAWLGGEHTLDLHQRQRRTDRREQPTVSWH